MVLQNSLLTTDFDLSKPESWGPTQYGCNVIHLNKEAALELTLSNGTWIIDVEDDEKGNFVGIGLTLDGSNIYYSNTLELILGWDKARFVTHNGKSDFHKLRAWGINLSSSQLEFDTMIASYVVDSTKESHGLKDLADKELGIRYPSYKQIVGTGKMKRTLEQQSVELVAQYNAMDCLCTYRLWKQYETNFTPSQLAYFRDLEMPIFRLLYAMEERGINIDVNYLNVLDRRLRIEIDLLRRKMVQSVGNEVNLNSHAQIKEMFLRRNGFDTENTSKSELQRFEGVAIIKDLLRFREIAKLRSTYTEPFLKLGSTVHTTFNQVSFQKDSNTWGGIRTGRLSSSDPNLQNIPARTETGNQLRRIFVPSEGMTLICADYSQIELRVLTHFCQEPTLLKAYRTGQDVHDTTAKALGIDRSLGKTINFAIVYGSGAWNLAEKVRISSAAAQMYLEKFEQQFPAIFRWKERMVLMAQKQGYATTLLQRQIKYKLEQNCKKHSRKMDNQGLPCSEKCAQRIEQEAGRRVISAIVQGSAAEIIKRAMLDCNRAGLEPILSVHDELLFESNEVEFDIEHIKSLMENVVKLDVPLTVSIHAGTSWADAKS